MLWGAQHQCSREFHSAPAFVYISPSHNRPSLYIQWSSVAPSHTRPKGWSQKFACTHQTNNVRLGSDHPPHPHKRKGGNCNFFWRPKVSDNHNGGKSTLIYIYHSVAYRREISQLCTSLPDYALDLVWACLTVWGLEYLAWECSNIMFNVQKLQNMPFCLVLKSQFPPKRMYFWPVRLFLVNKTYLWPTYLLDNHQKYCTS